jgi:hypothetical protein
VNVQFRSRSAASCDDLINGREMTGTERDMHRTLTRTLSIALVTGLLMPALLPAPAAAGSVSFTLAPPSEEGGDILSTGIRLYSMYRGLKNGEIRQRGHDNEAGVYQNGSGNVGFVRQRGDGHSATLRQNGNDNAYGIFQFGRHAQTDVEQDGDNQGGLTFSYGW